ncbi:Remorin family protein [Zea mays]|nr:Remorin family protein [Zea mays]ONM54842.1 Remorin family protein [Zea mays]
MTVWENMQKAEAAIQKLVIKLEKKRPYSLERIFNTLRSGSRKTQVVRSTSTANQNQHISRTIKTAPNLSKNGQMSSLSGCFRQDL